MDAPRRPDDPRDLLAAYRDVERLPAATRAAAWRDLQAELHAQPAAVTPRRNLAPALWGAVLLAAAVLLFLVRPAAVAPIPTTIDPQAAHDALPPSPVPTLTPERTARPVVVDPPADLLLETPPAPPSRPTREPSRIVEPRTIEPPTPQVPALERELALLRAAREALAQGDATTALTTLAEHAREFPAGHLREERLVLRVEALCAAGSRAEARADATSFIQAHPNSPHARKLQHVCP